MTKGVVSDKRRAQARKHASRRWVCVCGKVCKGNGGKSSHKAKCGKWRATHPKLGPVGPGFGAVWS